MANLTEVKVPDIGDASGVDIIEVLVNVGDEISVDDGLIVLETDKATMEVPASDAGVVKSIEVKVGDKVSEGDLILKIEANESSNDDASASDSEAESTEGSSSGDSSGGGDLSSSADDNTKQNTNQPKKSGGSRSEPITIPDIGDSEGVEVIEVSVKAGDEVEEDDSLIVLETEKATMEVPSPFAGTVESMSVKVGDKVSQGDQIGTMKVTDDGDDSSEENANEQASEPKAEKETSVKDQPMPKSEYKPAPVTVEPFERSEGDVIHASPAVRRLAREFGADLSKVKGSGRKNRIMKEDVQSYIKFELSRPKATANSGAGAPADLPEIDFSKFGEIEEKSLSRIQKISSVTLQRNWNLIPHVTQHDEADITELDKFRKSMKEEAAKEGVRLTPLAFIMKALVASLKAFPTFNSSLAADGETLILKKYFNIGVAVDTPDGLVVPVIRDVDKKSVYQLANELAEMSEKARDKKLTAKDMQGSSMTISSLGGIGGTSFTPIVNWPDVAILGLSRNQVKPVWNGKDFEPRMMLPMSLSYDHRVIDGAVAARFTVHLSKMLADIRRTIL
ncbi:dihydrolipoyllysine-residue acetyltransferase [Kangiella geojedonensis]|uniref:Acetyltransferase component of pyruvate dehydrogenase complex n=1 Tax=Kangiella geojedonensis TaxID=914150 RepID=A0A0F6RCQ4_9GAMM|nr:dihydrolipoyllysine-residue acetyltransferase [Kangiella geojedonensis]AKE52618.1 dihydrolipoamide acetyltransferase [Kangiella geojedonensis]